MAEFKSHIVRKAIETDEITYVRVLADQVCDMPILPMKYPVRQLDWKVTLNKGVVYLPKDGIYCRTLEIGYGCWINCNVFGRESIIIESGKGSKGNTLINGSIVSDGIITIHAPQKESRDKDYEDGCLIVKGNIIGKDVRIESPVIVYGNIFSEENTIINESTIVSGGVVSKNVMAQKLTCNFISGEKIEIGDLVSIFSPVIIAKDISFEKIRVITSVCKECFEKKKMIEVCKKHEGGKKIIEVCKKFGEVNKIHEEGKKIIDVPLCVFLLCDFNSCDRCLLMTPEDKIDFGDRIVVTTAWRTFKENEETYNWLKDVLCDLYNKREMPIDFGKLKHVGGISKGLKVELDVAVKPDVELDKNK